MCSLNDLNFYNFVSTFSATSTTVLGRPNQLHIIIAGIAESSSWAQTTISAQLPRIADSSSFITRHGNWVDHHHHHHLRLRLSIVVRHDKRKNALGLGDRAAQLGCPPLESAVSTLASRVLGLVE